MRAISERADKTWRMGILSINDVISVTEVVSAGGSIFIKTSSAQGFRSGMMAIL